MIFSQLFRALDWTAFMLRRYVLEWFAWFFGTIYFWIILKLAWVVDCVGYAFWFVYSRTMGLIGRLISKTFGSQVVSTAVASAGEAQDRAVEFGARKLFAVADAPIWTRLFYSVANFFLRISYGFGLGRAWLWEKTFGSSVAHVAVATAEQVPERAIGIGLTKLDTIQGSRLGQAIVGTARVIFRPLDSVYQFYLAWMSTRNFRSLWGAIPVVILAAPFLYIAIKIPFATVESRASAYREAAVKARRAGETTEASLFERKLAQMNIRDDGYDFRRALQNEASAGPEETYAEMLRLAPHDASGFPGAHRWIAMAIQRNKIELEEGLAESDIVFHHLDQYLSQEEGDAAALQLIAEILRNRDEVARAISYLGRIDLTTLPAVDLVRLAATYQRLQENQLAQQLAGQAIVKFEQMEEGDCTATTFLHWAAAQQMSDNNIGLANVLVAATQQLPQEKSKPFAPIAVRALKASEKFDSPDEFAIVSRLTIQAFPKDASIGQAIADRCKDYSTAKILNVTLAKEMRDEIVPTNVIGRIADVYAAHGDGVTARELYAQYHDQAPEDIRVTNNLAWLWATAKPINLKVAMSYADEAMRLDDNCAFALETRGQILFMLKRYPEAEKNLTSALNGLPNYAPIHTTLAKCYERLGDSDLAQRHAQVSKRLEQTGTN